MNTQYPSAKHKHRPRSLFLLFGLLLITLFLSACGSGGVGGNKPKGQIDVGTGVFSIEFPESLNKYLTEDTILLATISVDGGRKQNLIIDRKNKKLAGTIDGLTKGPHALVVEYSVRENGQAISIATGVIKIDVGDREILGVNYDAFVYTDNDKDGITNIAELELGTDIDDPTNKPVSTGLRGSANYAVHDAPINSSIVVGVASSENYTIQ